MFLVNNYKQILFHPKSVPCWYIIFSHTIKRAEGHRRISDISYRIG
jgi:hypothetical protein